MLRAILARYIAHPDDHTVGVGTAAELAAGTETQLRLWAPDILAGAIPAAPVNSDWDAASGLAEILNKPGEGTLDEVEAGTVTDARIWTPAVLNGVFRQLGIAGQVLAYPSFPTQTQADRAFAAQLPGARLLFLLYADFVEQTTKRDNLWVQYSGFTAAGGAPSTILRYNIDPNTGEGTQAALGEWVRSRDVTGMAAGALWSLFSRPSGQTFDRMEYLGECLSDADGHPRQSDSRQRTSRPRYDYAHTLAGGGGHH